jgi:hypothetical protein
MSSRADHRRRVLRGPRADGSRIGPDRTAAVTDRGWRPGDAALPVLLMDRIGVTVRVERSPD